MFKKCPPINPYGWMKLVLGVVAAVETGFAADEIDGGDDGRIGSGVGG